MIPRPITLDLRSGVEAVAMAVLGVSFWGSIAAAVFRYTSIQELGPRTMAVAGASGLVLGMFAVGGFMAASVLSPDPRFRVCIGVAAVPVALAALALGPTAIGLVSASRSPANADLSVLVQNLWYENPNPEQAAELLVAENAQVMVLVEYTTEFAKVFDTEDLWSRYPYRWSTIRSYGRGIAVFSEIPFDEPRDLGLSGPGVRLDLQLARHKVELFALHVNSPTSIYDLPRWRSDMEKLNEIVGSGRPEPDRILAGDFNSTDGHIRFRRLVKAGQLADAQDVGGGGFIQTWPVGSLVPPSMRLDHILVGRGLKVQQFEALPRVGSDHRGILANISVR